MGKARNHILIAVMLLTLSLCGARSVNAFENDAAVDYSKAENWAYWDLGEGKEADVFLICPTVDINDEFNMSLSDEETKANFLGALNMERGIYEETARLFAPYYQQAAMNVYSLTPEEREPYLEMAYQDVSDAFSYYLGEANEGRPMILAGFSQGADMCYRLLEEYFGDEELAEQLVAVYAIGWPLTEKMTDRYPQIKAAQCADDIGTIVSFDCEAEAVTGTLVVPEGTKALSINPLNWKTDSTLGTKEENLGACFTDFSGNIVSEEAALCGGYIDETRGVLKVTDVEAQDYPATAPYLPEGAYHVYDYQFFFRNLQENVKLRTEAYFDKLQEDAA